MMLRGGYKNINTAMKKEIRFVVLQNNMKRTFLDENSDTTIKLNTLMKGFILNGNQDCGSLTQMPET